LKASNATLEETNRSQKEAFDLFVIENERRLACFEQALADIYDNIPDDGGT
jgi:hypothetical protein